MIEYETKVLDIDKEKIISMLRELWAQESEEVFYKRWVYVIKDEWDDVEFIRIRDDGKHTTMTWKWRNGYDVWATQEIELVVDDSEKINLILSKLVFKEMFYRENYRKKFNLWDTEFCIDTRPMIPPYLEIESFSVEKINEWLDLLWLQGKDVWDLWSRWIYSRYWIDVDAQSRLTF